MKPLSPTHRQIILASRSPRRLELTTRIGFEPIVRVSEIKEERRIDETPWQYARRLAEEKALAVAAQLQGDSSLPGWILGADTIVLHEGDVLEKPGGKAEAREMLSRLSGAKHKVITAFCWHWRSPDGSQPLTLVVDLEAQVWMRELSPDFISRYVDSGEPMDKAGSYGIQDIGSVLVRRLEGSYFCVVGLPVCEVVESLEESGGLTGYPFPD